MRRDTQDELERLSRALLEEEAPPPPPEEEAEPEWVISQLEEDLPIEDVKEYKNHANHYGRAFNSDKTELSPEALSDALLEPEEEASGSPGLLLLAFLLLLGIVGVLIWLVICL